MFPGKWDQNLENIPRIPWDLKSRDSTLILGIGVHFWPMLFSYYDTAVGCSQRWFSAVWPHAVLSCWYPQLEAPVTLCYVFYLLASVKGAVRPAENMFQQVWLSLCACFYVVYLPPVLIRVTTHYRPERKPPPQHWESLGNSLSDSMLVILLSDSASIYSHLCWHATCVSSQTAAGSNQTAGVCRGGRRLSKQSWWHCISVNTTRAPWTAELLSPFQLLSYPLRAI